MSAPFLDTSVVVRYLVGTPEEAAARAQEIIEADEVRVVSELVLVEAAYVLTSFYGIPRERVVDALAELVQRHNLDLHHLTKPEALEALDLCRASGRVSFTDALLWGQARRARARFLFTFDRRFPQAGLEIRT